MKSKYAHDYPLLYASVPVNFHSVLDRDVAQLLADGEVVRDEELVNSFHWGSSMSGDGFWHTVYEKYRFIL